MHARALEQFERSPVCCMNYMYDMLQHAVPSRVTFHYGFAVAFEQRITSSAL